MEFEMLDQETAGKTIIKVVGVGGAGGNAVQHMIRRGVNGVEFICMNTDAGALQRSEASVNLQLGSSVQVRNQKSVLLQQKKRGLELQIHCKVRIWYSLLLVWVVAQEQAQPQSLLK